jgi:hypothetical protein
MSSSLSPSNSENSLNATSSTNSQDIDIDDETRDMAKNIQIASKADLEKLIAKIKSLLTETEEMSKHRIWLIRKLIEARYRLAHIDALREDVKSDGYTKISGHSFKILKQVSSKRVFMCDLCCNPIIWILQQSHICTDCFYVVHVKCLKYVTRMCAHIVVSEKGRPETRICPEIGLAAQSYRCAECNIQLMNKLCYLEPRQCHYSGLYYCKNCHWLNYSIIPGNIGNFYGLFLTFFLTPPKT